MKHLAHLNKYFFKYKHQLIPGILFVVIANIFAVLPAKVIRFAFDLVQENITLYRLSVGFERQKFIYQTFGYSLLIFGGIVLVLALTRGLFLFFMRQTIILMSRHIEYDLKNEIYNHYQILSLAFFKRNNTGDLMNRVSEDVSKVRMYIGPAVMYAINTVTLFGLTLVSMLQVNAKLTFYSLLPLPLMALLIYFITSRINKKSEKIQQQLSLLSTIAQETFSGIRIIKAFAKERSKTDDFMDASESYRQASMNLVKTQAFFYPTLMLLVGLSITLTVYVGGKEVIDGTITSGNIAEFLVYVNQLIFPVMSLGWITSLIQRAAASQKRINEFLQTKPDIVSSLDAKIPQNGNIEFNRVNFTYPNTHITALKNISFEIKQGEFVAITGRTGSGKTTLANLLMRMYDVESGSITLSGTPIHQLSLQQYRQKIGIVPQEVFLFSDTIANNIAFGLDDVTSDRITKAAKDAGVLDNILHFEEKFETRIGERGITLSGGQKQRIAIARALIKEPEILIFDDCLSAVDTKTEEEILRSISQIMKGKTCIVVAHRISTIKNADKIIVLDNGMLVEQGTHEELVEKGKIYTELYRKQRLEEPEA